MILLLIFNINIVISQSVVQDTIKTFNEEIEYSHFNPDTSNPNYIAPVVKLLPSDLLYNNKWDTLNIGKSHAFNLNKSDTLTIVLNRDDSNKFVFPFKGQLISDFGFRGKRPHTGTDIKLNLNDPVVSAFDGVVRLSRYYSGYGNMVLIRHNNGIETLYGHLNKRAVKVNQVVKAGEVIGYGGRTGRATCTHLHFETRYLEAPFNPHTLIDFPNYKLYSDTVIILSKAFKFNKTSKAKVTKAYASNSKTKSKINKNDTVKSTSNNNVTTKATINYNSNIDYYTVKKGDTLYSIAKRYGTTVNDLCKINHLTPKTTLNLGKKIKIH